jgi:hypothetical protein
LSFSGFVAVPGLLDVSSFYQLQIAIDVRCCFLAIGADFRIEKAEIGDYLNCNHKMKPPKDKRGKRETQPTSASSYLSFTQREDGRPRIKAS